MSDTSREGATINLTSTVVAVADQLWTKLDNEAVLLDQKRGTYYGLNEVGARIWELLERPRRVEEIRDVLVGEYEVEVDRCNGDLMALLQNLLNRGLIEVRDSYRV